jgi:hypothetical protein
MTKYKNELLAVIGFLIASIGTIRSGLIASMTSQSGMRFINIDDDGDDVDDVVVVVVVVVVIVVVVVVVVLVVVVVGDIVSQYL